MVAIDVLRVPRSRDWPPVISKFVAEVAVKPVKAFGPPDDVMLISSTPAIVTVPAVTFDMLRSTESDAPATAAAAKVNVAFRPVFDTPKSVEMPEILLTTEAAVESKTFIAVTPVVLEAEYVPAAVKVRSMVSTLASVGE